MFVYSLLQNQCVLVCQIKSSEFDNPLTINRFVLKPLITITGSPAVTSAVSPLSDLSQQVFKPLGKDTHFMGEVTMRIKK